MKAYKFLLGISFVLGLASCADFQEREFIKKELSGPLIKLEDVYHGQYDLYIVDTQTKDTMRYTLRISRFIKENNIQVGDSIAKQAESHTTSFYKKSDGMYRKVAELYYY